MINTNLLKSEIEETLKELLPDFIIKTKNNDGKSISDIIDDCQFGLTAVLCYDGYSITNRAGDATGLEHSRDFTLYLISPNDDDLTDYADLLLESLDGLQSTINGIDTVLVNLSGRSLRMENKPYFIIQLEIR